MKSPSYQVIQTEWIAPDGDFNVTLQNIQHVKSQQ